MARELELWEQRQEAERRLTPAILGYAVSRWGWTLVMRALVLFSTCSDPHALLEALPVFDRWFAFAWVPRPDENEPDTPATWPAVSLGLTWLAAGGAPASEHDRKFIRQAARSPYSALVVDSLWPGWFLDVRDLLTGRSMRVVDPDVAAHARVDDIIFSAVLTLDGVATLLGPAPRTLPSDSRSALLEHPVDSCDRDWMSRAELLEFDVAGEVCNEYVNALSRGPAWLFEADDEPREPLHLRWTVSTAFEEMLELLRPLSVCYGDEEAIELKNGPAGELHALITWYRQGPSGEEDDYDMIGELSLDEGRLSADVPTRSLASRLIAEVGARLGPSAVLVETRSAAPARLHTRPCYLPIAPE